MDPDLIKQLMTQMPTVGNKGLSDDQIKVLQRLAQNHANRTSAPAASQKKEFRMPTVYPTLKRCGLRVTMTLPANTPASCVLRLAIEIPFFKKRNDYQAEFPLKYYDVAREILMAQFGKVNEEEEPAPDPNAPVVIKVEYIGAVRTHNHQFNLNRHNRNRVTFDTYASAWVDGGWNVRFPEKVLRDFFPEPPPKFDGNFHKALLHGDINKTFKQLARQFHPDLNRSKDAHAMFLKLRRAYDDLRDPMRRKRYEAGLKFQTQALQKEVVFRVPKSCGLVEVTGEYEAVPRMPEGEPAPRLTVTKILSWSDIVNEQGQVMSSRWNSPKSFSADGRPLWERGAQPFTVEWLDNTDLEFDIDL